VAREPLDNELDRPLLEAIDREQGRLRGFIRRRVADARDAEDILQDVFFELVEAYRLTQPIEEIGAWLFRVARNRIVDHWRRRRREEPRAEDGVDDEEHRARLEEWLPSAEAGPEAAFARRVLIQELADAVDELPDAQRQVFIAHEIDGRSFRELAEETGLSINTLLSRKRYAVLRLRRRLRAIYREFIEPTDSTRG
jgi:RNA polymerase sigma factor (sigma-70 family)